MTFNDYLQSIPVENFVDICFEIAGREESWARILARCGAEILEEFNNDAIEFLEAAWNADHATEDTEEAGDDDAPDPNGKENDEHASNHCQ